ncbi:hypothetical protein VULLAG_LOCUS23114 [Vulpes lagopus]
MTETKHAGQRLKCEGWDGVLLRAGDSVGPCLWFLRPEARPRDFEDSRRPGSGVLGSWGPGEHPAGGERSGGRTRQRTGCSCPEGTDAQPVNTPFWALAPKNAPPAARTQQESHRPGQASGPVPTQHCGCPPTTCPGDLGSTCPPNYRAPRGPHRSAGVRRFHSSRKPPERPGPSGTGLDAHWGGRPTLGARGARAGGRGTGLCRAGGTGARAPPCAAQPGAGLSAFRAEDVPATLGLPCGPGAWGPLLPPAMLRPEPRP